MMCKFYEIDLTAQAEGDAMEAAYLASISEAEKEAMEAWAATDPTPNPLAKCGDYCKHLQSGRGFPGEYGYICTAPDNEHIIHVDFNESEII